MTSDAWPPVSSAAPVTRGRHQRSALISVMNDEVCLPEVFSDPKTFKSQNIEMILSETTNGQKHSIQYCILN